MRKSQANILSLPCGVVYFQVSLRVFFGDPCHKEKGLGFVLGYIKDS